MTDVKAFPTLNFTAAKSPVDINLLTEFGPISARGSFLVNIGPGAIGVLISHDDGVSFEAAGSLTSEAILSGSILRSIDRISIIHTGVDTTFVFVAAASAGDPIISRFHDSDMNVPVNYLSTPLLDGATVDMAVDGSSTAVEYSFTVPAINRYRVSGATLNLKDGNQPFDSSDFGDISGSLANGVEISVTPFGLSKIVLHLLKNNRDIKNIIPGFLPFSQQVGQSGDYSGLWPISDILGGKRWGMHLNAGDKFSVLIQDNLNPLDSMSFELLGRLEIVGL